MLTACARIVVSARTPDGPALFLVDPKAATQLVRGLTSRPLKFTLTSPYMLAKTLVNEFYPDTRALTMALAEVLRRQVADIDAAIAEDPDDLRLREMRGLALLVGDRADEARTLITDTAQELPGA